jgi:hypothetical protein
MITDIGVLLSLVDIGREQVHDDEIVDDAGEDQDCAGEDGSVSSGFS